MQRGNLDLYVDQLAQQCSAVGVKKRLGMLPRVRHLMQSFEGPNYKVPLKLKQLSDQLEDDAFEEMINNMPV